MGRNLVVPVIKVKVIKVIKDFGKQRFLKMGQR